MVSLYFPIFFHPDCTVGFGVSPNQDVYKRQASICVFDAACSGVTPQGRTYGGAGTLHTGNLRYRYHISDGQISCDVSSIEVYFPESDSWQPLDFHKAYSTSFTFESSQNLVSLLPWASKMATGQALPFAPYDEATGTYMDAVSYTHLDVYKRQMVILASLARGRAPFSFFSRAKVSCEVSMAKSLKPS